MTDEPQRGGRPRDTRVDAAILAATRTLLAEVGYGALTMDLVAGRANVGKAAIYRRYAGKQDLVFAAAVHGRTLDPPPDSGDLRTDLRWLVGGIARSLSSPETRAALPALLADVTADDDVADRFMRTFVAEERAYVETILDQARRRGDLRTPVDAEVVHSLVLGAIFARIYLLRKPADKAYQHEVTDLAAKALTEGAR
ncbi:AcrR family transcriptional regulator [Hamadaea flava]|uniref:TetR/AcrR family transcriptional regulator n=1 Tax=Hamadaea flava TaxID=1742688 RepID=A0ABV8LIG9_9ACTN|nr:TetR/AcrR family transcriptional regulator [Hamadaea flava]MCP2324339.1 AcrR family transcriptional regulator [Hamadaea flava]